MKTAWHISAVACLLGVTIGLALVEAHAPIRDDRPPGEWKEWASLPGHGFVVSWVAFSPDSKTLASASDDKTVRLWDLASEKSLLTLSGHTREVGSVTFFPDGKSLASRGADHTIRLWNASDGKCTATLTEPNGFVGSPVIGPDGRTLATGVGTKILKLWDLTTNREQSKTSVGYLLNNHLVYTPKGKLLAVTIDLVGRTLTFWDISDNKKTVIEEGAHYNPMCVAFSRDGKILAGGFLSDSVRVWDTASGKLTATFKQDKAHYTCLAFSPDGKTLAIGYKEAGTNSGVGILLVDLKTGKEITTLKGHTGPLFCVTFSPDGKMLASSGYDKAIKIWGQGDPKKPAK